MRTRFTLLAAVSLALPLAGRATTAPHDASTIQNSAGCENCHIAHKATGPTLTNQPDNFTECTNCHNNLAAGFTFGGKWYSSDHATPGAGGHSHHWGTRTTNPAYGASPPTNSLLSHEVHGGVMQCSTCQDQHAASPSFAPQNLHVSVQTGTALAQSGGAASGATMTLTVASGQPVP